MSPRQVRAVVATVVVILVLALVGLVSVISRGSGERPGPPAPSPTAPVPPAPTPSPTPTSGPSPVGLFGIGTLNWRGASHYRKDPHPGEQPYDVRMPHMIAKLEASAVTIAGFQEFERRQARLFLKQTGRRWGLVRGTLADGTPDTRDAIAYRHDAWKVREVRTVQIIYAGNHPVRIPLVRFTARSGTPAQGRSIWVLNTHNPASVRFIGGTAQSREYDVRIQAQVLRQLAERSPSTGVFFTGDMNSKTPFRDLFLSLVGHGWTTADPPHPRRLIDWIMAGPGVRTAATVVDWSTHDDAHRYTDHPFVHTRVTALP